VSQVVINIRVIYNAALALSWPLALKTVKGQEIREGQRIKEELGKV